MCGTRGMGAGEHRHCWQPGNVLSASTAVTCRLTWVSRCVSLACQVVGFGGVCFGSGLPPLNLPVTGSCKETSTLCDILYWDPNNVPKQLCPTPLIQSRIAKPSGSNKNNVGTICTLKGPMLVLFVYLEPRGTWP